MCHAGLWVITRGTETQRVNQVRPRHQGAHLVFGMRGARCGGASRRLWCCGRCLAVVRCSGLVAAARGQGRGERRLMNTLERVARTISSVALG